MTPPLRAAGLRAPAIEARPSDSPFDSWLMGGFEGSSMLLADGRRVDPIARTGHDVQAERDYRLLASAGIRTVRDALRWHLIETRPGHYDWSSFLPMLGAARRTGMQVIWDLCHFGLPDGVDPWSHDLVERFADFARAAAQLVAAESETVPIWCPVNEISYWAFAGGSMSHFQPMGRWQGAEWKRQLVRMTLAAIRAVREVDARARFVQTDPLIHIVSSNADEAAAVEDYRLAMFEAWDMITGRLDPDLGGSPDCLDVVGVNFYADNEWVHNGPRLRVGDPLYRPFHEILAEVAARYDRPIIISETGGENEAGLLWVRHMLDEVRIAAGQGLPVEGLCLYPVMHYPGWTDDRHCNCGLIQLSADWRERRLDGAMVTTLRSCGPTTSLRTRAARF